MSGTSAIGSPSIAQDQGLARFLAPLSVFLGASLLFFVEPLIAKLILPWFGGSAEVWIVCLLFFQLALLAGYIYAHLLAMHVRGAWRWRLHLGLLAACMFFLPILPSENWKPDGGEEPLPLILGVLGSTIGLPFLLLAATAPLIQSLVAAGQSDREGGARSVYRLYALSNFGSLFALLLYPLIAEPWFSSKAQAWIWSFGFSVFAIVSGMTIIRCASISLFKNVPVTEPSPTFKERATWFVLSLAPSALLLALTHHMSQNVAAIPLLWVVPLGLYLLSFIVAFDNPRWYYRPVWFVLFAVFVGPMIYFEAGLFPAGSYIVQLVFYSGGLFVCCMVCHGELAARKPISHFLTSFYLLVAAGGAAGGLLVALGAPSIFNDDYDLALILPGLALFVIFQVWRHVPAGTSKWLRWNILAIALYVWAFATGTMAMQLRTSASEMVLTARNFYGTLKVARIAPTETAGEIIQLWNGNIIHGREFTYPQNRCEPISYYGPQSGIGIAIQEMGQERPLTIGVIGLGAGMIAGYGRSEDVFRFYEINPLVQHIATTSFYYLPSCPAQWSVEMGDARLSLERETSQQFDVLAVDAFSSDAIPVHLLTEEAFALYWRHLKPEGVLAVHVSNRYVDLAPIVSRVAGKRGDIARLVTSARDPQRAIDGSNWVLVTRTPEFFSRAALSGAKEIAPGEGRLWTDDYSNLLGALK